MKTITSIFLLFFFTTVIAQDKIFVHTATPANSGGHITYIDHPDLNGNSNANIIVTHNYNPSGGSGILNNNVTGTWYDGTHWSIFNEDVSAIVDGSSYNVYIVDGAQRITHTADGSSYSSIINDPAIDNNPTAKMAVSRHWNPFGVYNARNYGFWFDGAEWNLYAEDLASQPVNASYTILVDIGTGGATSYKHTATSGNISNNWTELDHPDLNGNPDATLVIGHNWGTTGDAANVVLDKVLGVWYTGTVWAVYIEDQSAMPENVVFDIYIAPNGTLGVEDNIIDSLTYFPNPTTDFVTIQATVALEKVTIFNVLGQQLKTVQADGSKITVNISDQPKGYYLAQVQAGDAIETIKLIKK